MSQTIRRCALIMVLSLLAARSVPVRADACDACHTEPSPPTGPEFVLVCNSCYVVEDCAALYPGSCQPVGECSEYQGVASAFMKCS